MNPFRKQGSPFIKLVQLIISKINDLKTQFASVINSETGRVGVEGAVGVAQKTDILLDDTTALTPKYAVIDGATSGNNTLVAAVSGKKIRIISLILIASGDVTVRFESGANGTAMSGQMNVAEKGGLVLPFSPVGWGETASNTLLNLELSGAVSVDGMLVYVEV